MSVPATDTERVATQPDQPLHGPIRYRMTGLMPWFCLPILGLITALGFPLVVVGIATGSPPLWFGLVWLGALGWMWFQALVGINFEVTLWPDDGRLQFRSVLRTRQAAIADLTSVAPSYGGMNPLLVTFRYRGGSVQVPRTLDGWYDLITRVRNDNPTVQLQGV